MYADKIIKFNYSTTSSSKIYEMEIGKTTGDLYHYGRGYITSPFNGRGVIIKRTDANQTITRYVKAYNNTDPSSSGFALNSVETRIYVFLLIYSNSGPALTTTGILEINATDGTMLGAYDGTKH